MSWNLWWRFDARDQVIVGPPPLAGDDWRRRRRAQPPTTPKMQVLTDVMVDAWVAAGRADAGHTLSSSNPLAPREAWQIDHRIDYVMARPGTPERPVAVEHAELAGGPQDGLYPSDHYAVVADVRL